VKSPVKIINFISYRISNELSNKSRQATPALYDSICSKSETNVIVDHKKVGCTNTSFPLHKNSDVMGDVSNHKSNYYTS
jgi:hypothetical protein